MTFLQIAVLANSLCGMQGTVSSVTVTSGYQEILIKFLKDAYIELQNYRDWPWLRSSEQFNTVAGTTEYSLQTIVGIADTIDIKKYVKGGVLLIDSNGYRSRLSRTSYDAYLVNDIAKESQAEPYIYAEDPIDKHLYINPPDDAYTIEVHFYTYPVELSANADIPLLPVAFHRLIAIMGARRMAAFMGNGGLYQELTVRADSMLGELLRQENPAKRIHSPGIA